MKAITVLQPYASLIIEGHKPCEFRSWATSYRGPIAIHAGRLHFGKTPFNAKITIPKLQDGRFVPVTLETLHFGVILGVAELVDCLPFHELNAAQRAFCAHYRNGSYGFVLENVRRLREPIAARGMQRLWNWQAPDDLETRFL